MKQQLENPYPVSAETSERQTGGQHSATGEKHGQRKAQSIPCERRYPGAPSADADASGKPPKN